MRDKGLHNCVTKGYTTVYGPVSHRLVLLVGVIPRWYYGEAAPSERHVHHLLFHLRQPSGVVILQ